MKIVETVVIRDEADIIDAHVAFNLNAGVDFVVAIDHESQDGTTEILETYAREGYLRRIPERGAMREEEWRTRLARLAAAEHGADWVINADADQFWWPRGGDLRDVLAAIPPRFGAVRAFDRVFVPRPDDGAHFAERMILRMSAPAPINAPVSTYRPLARVVHRGDREVRVARGGHSISGARLAVLPNWHPIEVLHFPWRSSAQMTRKARHLVRAFEGGPRHPTGYHSEAYRAVEEKRPEAHYSALALDDDSLQRGFAENVIVVDTRVRDVLRLLAAKDGLREANSEHALPTVSAGLRIPWPTAEETAAYAAEAAVLREADIVRAFRLLDRLESRLGPLERKASSGRRRVVQRAGSGSRA